MLRSFRSSTSVLILLGAIVVAVSDPAMTALVAQDVVVSFCDPTDCPSTQPECCVGDTFEVTFPAGSGSVFEYDELPSAIEVVVEADTETANIEGWSFGVRHDGSDLSIMEDSVTIEGTSAGNLFRNGFALAETVDGGWVSAVILSYEEAVFLPQGVRSSLAKATYVPERDVGQEGTLIELVDEELSAAGSPPTPIVYSIGGQARFPNELTQGVVRQAALDVCPDWAFYFGDAVTDLTFDARGQVTLPISMRNETDSSGFQMGVSLTDENGAQRFRFSGDLGPGNSAPNVSLGITNENGDTESPLLGNEALASFPFEIERGAAIAGLAETDFFDVDLSPVVGGPGFTIEYISDPDNLEASIPATPDEVPCSVNEILLVVFEGPPPECADWGLYFGPAVTDARYDGRGQTSIPISMRNATDSPGTSFGIRVVETAEGFSYSFSNELAPNPDLPVRVVITNDQGQSEIPETPNVAIADVFPTGVGRGVATEDFAAFDFFEVNLEPAAGGPGLTVGYVTDFRVERLIPATGEGEPCPVNDVFSISLVPSGDGLFDRGDVDGSGSLNITDAVVVILFVTGRQDARFDCFDVYDTNDDGKVDISDPLPILFYLFQGGERLPPPFLECGRDATDDGLTCNESSFACGT